MLQTPKFHGSPFSVFPLEQDGLAASEVDVGGGEIAEAFVIATVVVVGDKGIDLGFEASGQEVVFQEDPVLQRLMPTLDLALRLGMVRGTANVADAVVAEPVC